MADQAIEKFTPLGSVILHYESPIVCMESGLLSTPAATAVADLDLVGCPVIADGDDFTLALETEQADIVGIVAEQGMLNLASGGTTERPVRILARGPAAINGDKLPVADPAGTDWTAATMKAALETLGIQVREEPAETSVQES